MGGNLCNGSPAADSVPALIAAGAIASIAGPNGRREVPVEDIMQGPRRLALARGEIVASFLLPPRPARTADAYLRFIPRTEMDIAVVGCGVCLTLDASGTCTAARVALGAVAPRPLPVPEAARALVGTKLDAGALDTAGRRRPGRLPAHRRQARHQGIPHQGGGRAGAPRRPDRPRARKESLNGQASCHRNGQRRSRRVPVRDRRTRCSTRCATSWASPAPRKAAPPATAAPAA